MSPLARLRLLRLRLPRLRLRRAREPLYRWCDYCLCTQPMARARHESGGDTLYCRVCCARYWEEDDDVGA